MSIYSIIFLARRSVSYVIQSILYFNRHMILLASIKYRGLICYVNILHPNAMCIYYKTYFGLLVCLFIKVPLSSIQGHLPFVLSFFFFCFLYILLIILNSFVWGKLLVYFLLKFLFGILCIMVKLSFYNVLGLLVQSFTIFWYTIILKH